MLHPIIKTDNYILITSDEEIKIGDIVLETYLPDGTKGLEQVDTLNDIHSLLQKKVIAHLPLNNSPILEDIPLLPPLTNEEDVEKLAEKEITFVEGSSDIKGMIISAERGGFVKGFSKAKEKYKFTEDDVIKIVEKSRETGLTAEYLMLSLSQPKLPVGFKCEMVEFQFDTGFGDYPKIINGVMQGKWIFE